MTAHHLYKQNQNLTFVVILSVFMFLTHSLFGYTPPSFCYNVISDKPKLPENYTNETWQKLKEASRGHTKQHFNKVQSRGALSGRFYVNICFII